jgi:tetratricopeptide (TPR) repeat protein
MKTHNLLLLSVLLAGTAACSNAPAGPEGAKGAYARGLAALDKGLPGEARIELLNAIKAAPEDGRIRVAQARTYLMMGDGVAAQAELDRARTLRVPAADTHHLMAHALLLQNRPQDAVDEAAKAPPAHHAYAARMRGRALMVLGNNAEAGAAFDKAVAAGEKDSAVWADVARFRRATGNVAGAIGAADRAVQLNPKNVEALSLRGEITRSQYGLAAAIAWFDRALEVDPEHVPTLVERAATLGDLGRMSEMLAETRKIQTIAPNHPVAYYLQAMLAARAKKFDLARSLYQRTGGTLDDKPAGMLLASAIDFETGNAEQAIQRLQKAGRRQPEQREGAPAACRVAMALGDVAGTIQTLRPLADRPDADSYVLTLIGKAYDRQGNAEWRRATSPAPRSRSAARHRSARRARWTTRSSRALRRKLELSPKDAQLQDPAGPGTARPRHGPRRWQRARRCRTAIPASRRPLSGRRRARHPGRLQGRSEEYARRRTSPSPSRWRCGCIEALRNSGNPSGAARVLELYLSRTRRTCRPVLAQQLPPGKQWDGASAFTSGCGKRLGDRDATLLNNLAWAYSEKGEPLARRPAARPKAWELDKQNPATSDTYGWLLFKSGRTRRRAWR